MIRRASYTTRWLIGLTAGALLPLLPGCQAPPGLPDPSLSAEIKAPASQPEADPDISFRSLVDSYTTSSDGRFYKFTYQEPGRALSVLLPVEFGTKRECRHDWQQTFDIYAERVSATEKTTSALEALGRLLRPIEQRLMLRFQRARSTAEQQAALTTAFSEVEKVLPAFVNRLKATGDPRGAMIAAEIRQQLAVLRRPEMLTQIANIISRVQAYASQQQPGAAENAASTYSVPGTSFQSPAGAGPEGYGAPPATMGGPGAVAPPMPGGMAPGG